MARLLGACMLLLAAVLVVAAASSARADNDPSGGTGIRQPDSAYRGRKVGGRTEVRDVEGNEEVQRLGRFSVAEYNRRQQQQRGGGGSMLEFGRVVSAQRQVVSGLMYYLRVAAAEEAGGERVFDAVVVVKPWLDSRTLLRFAPATTKYA
ncbi:hypothetical protein BS78_03G379400 [Paspalum vaginatum]|nr:hypothetical protein BS78_03G379200 [Paspalum vaginatum]KAJ1286796.1 hypothetical protein BS78_03G379400 [Paspalum vaginatum]